MSRGKRRGPSTRVKLLISLVIAVVGLEGFVRLGFWAAGTPYDMVRSKQEVWRSLNAMSPYRGARASLEGDNLVPHPYFGWERVRKLPQTTQDLMSFGTPDAADRFDVLVVGSSVGASLLDRGSDRIIETLQRDSRLAGRPIQLLHYARGAFKQPQQLNLVCYLLTLGFEPDAILCVDGFNELVFSMSNNRRGVHPTYPSVERWSAMLRETSLGSDVLDAMLDVRSKQVEAKGIGSFALDAGFFRSCILARITRARIGRLAEEWEAARQRYIELVTNEVGHVATAGPPFSGSNESAVAVGVEVWRRAIETLDLICEGRSIPFVSIIQPTLCDVKCKQKTAEEAAFTSSELMRTAAEIGYPEIRKVGTALRKQGIQCVDLSRMFADIEVTLFVDVAHLNAEGVDLMAERTA